MKQILVLSLVFLSSLSTYAQDVFGKWRTIDDETGKVKSVVEVYEQGGKLHAKVLEIFFSSTGDLDPSCTECTDDRKDKKVIGMDIIRGMKKKGDEWKGGTICDPKNGKVYDCKLWMDEDNNDVLLVRGYIAFLFRTQTWERVK